MESGTENKLREERKGCPQGGGRGVVTNMVNAFLSHSKSIIAVTVLENSCYGALDMLHCSSPWGYFLLRLWLCIP